MTSVVDRRSDNKNKSAVNRSKFLKRYKDKIKGAISDSLQDRSIKDLSGDEFSIPSKDISEPYFGHGNGGIWETVSPGNSDVEKGDRFRRPSGGKGRGKGGSDSDDIFDDEFVFTLSKEEFIDYFFEDLELPNLVKKQLKDTTSFKHQRAGYKTSGATTNIHVLRSLCNATGRRIALSKKPARKLKEAIEKLQNAVEGEDTIETRLALIDEVLRLQDKVSRVPFIDPFDLRYSNTVLVPKPSSKAVMFCLMDVSGSMGEYEKTTAKKFFVLLYLFLSKAYQNVELVFIRHHTQASEVTEHEFFHSTESGGTMVSSALELLGEIIKERYASGDCNLYVAQASDGDNFTSDSAYCGELMADSLLSLVQYFAYIEITAGITQNLWDVYEKLEKVNENFAIEQVRSSADIYPVFRELFKKQEA